MEWNNDCKYYRLIDSEQVSSGIDSSGFLWVLQATFYQID